MSKGFKDLLVWKKSVELVKAVYVITEHFPSSEIYGLTSQMKRASISISSNIAEGSRRGSKKDFERFLCMADGSCAELEAQVEIAKQLPFGKEINYSNAEELIGEVGRMINGLKRSLQ